VVHSDEPLAQYGVAYERNQHHLKSVHADQLYPMPFQSPQPFLWQLRHGEWLTALRLSPRQRRRRREPVGEEPALFG